MMAAKTTAFPSKAYGGDPQTSGSRQGEHSSRCSAAGTDSSTVVQPQSRSKCFTFAMEFRQRNGPDSVLPSFIFERLGQEGMTEDDINIGRGQDQKPASQT